MTTANDAAQKHRCAGSGLHCVIHACVAPSRDRRRSRRTRARRRCSSHSRAEAPRPCAPARVSLPVVPVRQHFARPIRDVSHVAGQWLLRRHRAEHPRRNGAGSCRSPARVARRGWVGDALHAHALSVSLDAPCRHSQTASESCGGQCRRISAPLAVPRVEGPLGRRRAVFRHGVPPCGRGARKGRRNSIESVR
jgi:hypothetical protein